MSDEQLQHKCGVTPDVPTTRRDQILMRACHQAFISTTFLTIIIWQGSQQLTIIRELMLRQFERELNYVEMKVVRWQEHI